MESDINAVINKVFILENWMPIIHITAIIQRLIRYTEVIAKTEIHESMPLSDVSDSNFLLINIQRFI